MFTGIFLLLVFVVALVEVVLEPLVETSLGMDDAGFNDWHEVVLWAVSIIIPAIIGGYLLSKKLSDKLDSMNRVSKQLALGDLGARLAVTGDDNDGFDIMARNFNEMADAIERQLRDERRLLADISHELRSPITRMTIAVELLKRRQGQDNAMLLRLESEVGHMGGLVGTLLQQAKERAHKTGKVGDLDLTALLQEVAGDFDFEGRRQEKRVTLAGAGSLVIQGNELLLRRMLGNLLSNALFYTPVGGSVEVTAVRLDDMARITVRDFGPGVPAEQLESIFRAFYRVDDSRARSSGGVGLGLALVKEAVGLHGGFVMAENAGPGLRVTVTLPVPRAAAPEA